MDRERFRRGPRAALALLVGCGLAFGGYAFASSTPSSGSARLERVTPALGMRVLSRTHAGVKLTRVLTPAAAAANAATFSDPSGDSGNAADITTISVSNDDQGTITLGITLANRPSLQGGDLFLILMDTDLNASTGGGGFDYALGANSSGCGLFQVSGSTLTSISATTLSCSFSSGVLNSASIGAILATRAGSTLGSERAATAAARPRKSRRIRASTPTLSRSAQRRRPQRPRRRPQRPRQRRQRRQRPRP